MVSSNHPGQFELYTVYENPADYPGKFVVRRFTIEQAHAVADRDPWFIGDTLHDARNSLPQGLTRIDRDPNDDPVILETWI
jgi:hypothetical protein